MQIDEAFKILGVSKTASEDEIKQKYKTLAKQYHPDVFKDDPNKFKEINQAHDLVKDYQKHPNKYNPSPFGRSGNVSYGNINIEDIFSQFNDFGHTARSQQPVRNASPVQIQVDISFKEAILGCDKEIKYARSIKCSDCNGVGVHYKGNGCDSCNGFGQSTKQKGNIVFSTNCGKCRGRDVQNEKCSCDNGTKPEEISGSVSIPPGRQTNDTLRMIGKGNFVGNNIFGDQYTDVFVKINVEKDDDMSLIGNDVVSTIQLSLIEALSGCEKDIRTINGNEQIAILPMSKNKDEAELPNLGVKGTNGKHRVILNVNYPDEATTNKLIELLKEQNGN